MLHAQQALERYDASGQPILQFLELWMDGQHLMQAEVSLVGQTLSYTWSSENEHLSWAADTLKAVRGEESLAFLPDFAALQASFDQRTELSGQSYAGRACSVILLEDAAHEEDWLKIYRDEETGFVLFCEAPLFRLRTSLLEILPIDEHLLTPPAGLVF